MYTYTLRAVTWQHWMGLTIARRTNRNGRDGISVIAKATVRQVKKVVTKAINLIFREWISNTTNKYLVKDSIRNTTATGYE